MSSTVSFFPDKTEFTVRIVVCDHYLAKPTPGIDVIYSDFRGADIKQVPVLRIFGPTPNGRKACVHVHGVFPYFYIPCPTPNPEPQFLYQIAASLDKALNIALKQASSSNQHIYKITLVKGLPFYGFHDKEHLYLKVFLYSPGLVKQAVELCSNGAILGQAFQPHESHINFTLQFFIDFNLFGMSNIDFQSVLFRRSGLSQKSNDPFDNNMSALKPESTCFYEADCIASHIINRQKIGKGDGIENPGLEEVWKQEIERRKRVNISLASKSLSQGRLNSEETESHNKFKEIFLMKISSLIDKPIFMDHEIDEIKEIDYYPAESVQGSQLLNAVDVSVHLPDNTLTINRIDTSIRDLDLTYIEEANNTLVDENVALNSSLSLHYSQVLLNGEDLELIDLLQEMADNSIEEDSIMKTPAGDDVGDDNESDDMEYSQIFNEDTILLNTQDSKGDANKSLPSWNDTFWDDANIPQLDGTCDDDHVKKVRKRKMRSFKLGLSKPKSKIEQALKSPNDEDEINASRETIDNISKLHIKKSVKLKESSLETSAVEDISISKLVDIITHKHNNIQLKPSELYDLKKKYTPMAGSSTDPIKTENDFSQSNANNSAISFNDSQSGIVSFYDNSKIFDTSLSGDDSIQQCQERMYQKNEEFSPLQVENDEKLSNVNSHQVEHITRANHEKEISLRIITPKYKAPLKSYVVSTLQNYKIPKVKNVHPFYSDHKDVGDKVEIGQIMLKLQSKLSRDQKPFDKVLDTTSIEEWRQLLFLQTNHMAQDTLKPDSLKLLLAGNKNYILESVKRAPTRKIVEKWSNEKANHSIFKTIDISKQTADINMNKDELDNSQALGLNEDVIDNSISEENSGEEKSDMNTLQVTMQPDGSFLCFGSHENGKESICTGTETLDVNFLTLMLIEVHTSVRRELHPDPVLDPIEAVFYTVTNDCPPGHFLQKSYTGILVIDKSDSLKYLDRCVHNVPVTYVNNECEIIEKIIELVREHDPDIICGYEIEMNSWGYVFERAQLLTIDIVTDISRITERYRQKRWRNDERDLEGRIIGRVVFNVWRLFRHELALSSYSFENCMYEVLKERVPTYSYAQLSEWWSNESRIFRWIPIDYYLMRLSGTVRMLEKLDIINRTSELARLFGLQWWEVLSRGTQFRVESLMLRAARPLNLIALSPTVKQRAKMRAPECLPLIFEPESRFYSDPVIVLDFQSLYPSMMIAYNYCFSTCIGRVQNITGDSAYEFGTWRLKTPKAKLEALSKNDLVNWSPVGVGFVKPSVRRGVLPALLRRILAARQAVKKSMKMQTDETVKRAMHSRQLGLKLIANVTYGYTSANFSGRMPCVEVGDSVVAKGRETLERAIKLVQSNSKWNAKVVYGDTDSMFVVIPGGTRAEAFVIGQEIADAVTADNPSPVALKLEKVYQPCILQTKKRYVGYMYESPDQENPVYEAKGIETVRRDGCPAGVKLLRESLCELFSTRDMSRVKARVQAVLSRLADGSLPSHQLLFTREYHGAAGYRPGAAAPPREIAIRIGSRDRRAVPRAGWRVSWLVTAGAPGTPLVRLARTPKELLRDPSLRPHIAYYAARVLLPPLHRCLSLLGVDVFKWWNELGYTRMAQQRELSHTGGIARYMSRERCAVCGARVAIRAGASDAVCADCAYTQRAAATLNTRFATADTLLTYSNTICKSCCGHSQMSMCENTECPLLWKRLSTSQMLMQIHELLSRLPSQSLHF